MRRSAAWAAPAVLLACADPEPVVDRKPPVDSAIPAAAAVAAAEWRATPAFDAPFRAFAWGAGDTLWGIVRGRLAAAAPDGSVRRLEPIAWDVHASAAGALVSWTNEQGLYVRRGDSTAIIARPPFLGDDYTVPDVLWSQDGRRALLTWTGEAGTRHTLLDGAAHRPLDARLAGYMSGAPTLWLDEARAVLAVTAFAARAGSSEHREAGYRADIAILDVVADSIWLVTDAADGQYLTVEGLLHADTVLVGSRTRDGPPESHLALDLRRGVLAPLLNERGRAAAAHGAIALLRTDSGDGGEQTWTLAIFEGQMRATVPEPLTGFAVKLLWHPTQRRLAVSTESEAAAGYRTVIVEARPVR